MDKSSTLNWKDEDYYRQHPSRKQVRGACLQRVDWRALCKYASSINADKPCSLLDKSTIGGVHLIRLLNFGDTQWIARVQLESSTPTSASLLRAEINAMELVRARTDIPVPKVYDYELHDANSVRAAFILMEFLPGSSAMDADRGYEVHQGSILPPAMDDPRNYKVNGQPRDPDSIQVLKERAQYTQYIQEKEREFKMDQKLSTILLNTAAQGLAYAMKVYLDPGKLGFYCNVLQSFGSS